MATQTSSTNTRLVAIGAVVLLVGVILVLLILRGAVGDDEPAAQPSATDDGTEQPEPSEPDAELVEGGEGSTARVPLPLEVAAGQEAVTVRATFARGVGALPVAGDRVAVYRLDDPEEEQDDEDVSPFPPAGEDAERLLEDVEVLGVIGPRPAANDGTLTFVLAIDEAEVAGLLPVARDGSLWLTLLPGQDEGTDTEDGGDDE